MKYNRLIWLVVFILIIDQLSKYYIKTHFYLGESLPVLGNWFQLCFIENEGMAFGMKIMDSPTGKVLLTSFRLVAVVFGFFWVKKLVLQGYSKGLLICAALILAGAAGNLIDSLFYGMIFTESGLEVARLVPWGAGYAGLMHGKVVDMLYFPLIDSTWPDWVPVKGGTPFRFFEPIFNIADMSISTGILTLLVFQKRLMKRPETTTTATTSVEQVTDQSQ